MGQQMTMSSVSWAKSQESENKVTFFFFLGGGIKGMINKRRVGLRLKSENKNATKVHTKIST
jgi:hypothetical protein